MCVHKQKCALHAPSGMLWAVLKTKLPLCCSPHSRVCSSSQRSSFEWPSSHMLPPVGAHPLREPYQQGSGSVHAASPHQQSPAFLAPCDWPGENMLWGVECLEQTCNKLNYYRMWLRVLFKALPAVLFSIACRRNNAYMLNCCRAFPAHLLHPGFLCFNELVI